MINYHLYLASMWLMAGDASQAYSHLRQALALANASKSFKRGRILATLSYVRRIG